MSKRRDTPALFELVRSSGIKKPGSAARPTGRPPADPARSSAVSRRESDESDPHGSTSPPVSTSAPSAGVSAGAAVPIEEPAGLGRTIRVPLGYVVLAVGATVVLLVIAYSVGFTRGKLAANGPGMPNESSRVDQSQGNGNGGVDGRGETESSGGVSPANRTSIGPTRESNAGSTTREAGAPNDGRGMARDLDTRQVGLNYIIVEQFGDDEAQAVADFLERQGIDVMVLPTNNRNLRQVIVRRGYEGWRSNADAQQMLDRIKRRGRQWKRDYGGTKDFEDAFGSRYDG